MGSQVRTLGRTVRSLSRQPAAALAAVLIFALGLGIGTALFGAAWSLLWDAPPAGSPGELVALFTRHDAGGYGYLSLPDVDDLRQGSRTLEGLAAYTDVEVALQAGDATTRIQTQVVTADYFQVLQVAAASGRVFAAGESVGEPRLVLADHLWKRLFGGDPTLVGRAVTVNGTPFTVLGIAPPGFTGTDPALAAEAWIPLDLHGVVMPDFGPDLVASRDAQWLVGIGRRREGASRTQVAQELEALFAHGRQASAAAEGEWRLAVLPGRSGTLWPPDRAEIARLVRLASGGAALLLLIVCANVSALLLVRSASRRNEMALRQALGARRISLLRLALLDSLVLSAAGAFLALPVALAVSRALGDTRLAIDPGMLELSGTLPVLAFTALSAVVVAVVSAIAPALATVRFRLHSALTEAAAVTLGGRGRTRTQRTFSVFQVALAVVLLSADALLLVSYRRLADTELGFSPERVLVLSVDPALSGFPMEAWSGVYQRLHERVSGVQGVEAASVAFPVPFGDWRLSRGLVVPGRAPEPDGYTDVVNGNLVSPGYFRTLGVPRLAGRDFTLRDGDDAPLVGIVSRSLAEELWPGSSAVGKRFALWDPEGDHRPLEVVGVVADARQGRRVTEEPGPRLYLPLLQHPMGSATVLVRAQGGAAALAPSVEAAVHEALPELAAFDTHPFEAQIARSLQRPRSAALILSGIGGLALVLSLAGLYGLLSYVWTQRGREIGLRMALGAARGDILRLVVRQGAQVTAVGILLGLLPAPLLGRWLAPWLEAPTLPAPVLVLGVAAVVAASGVAGALIPAWRASRVQPLDSLRNV